MVKDIVVVADLGAAGNLVRNLIMLSDQVDWPLSPASRFDTISKQYNTVELKQWLSIEYRLRFWKQYYNVDLSDGIDLTLFQARNKTTAPAVYLNHTAFFQPDEYQALSQLVTTLYVAPVTEFGLRWQIRSYCEKKTVEKLHNFTFDNNIDQRREQYCQEHGTEEYFKLNIKNFFEIVGNRQQEFGNPNITLETLLLESPDKVTQALCDHLNISIDTKLVEQILTKWRNCHWPIEKTNSWKYYDNNA